MKILYVTTVPGTMKFFLSHFQMLTDEGHTVELACNCENEVPEVIKKLGFKVHSVAFSRSPLSSDNIKAYRQLRELIKNEEYDIVHTHTPNASACVRLACRNLRKKGLKVFYTAHGFHFYTGAPKKNWLLYYPVEWICAHWTDKLITINKEDYARSKKHMHAKHVVYVPGVGIDLNKFGNSPVDRERKRQSLSIPKDKTWLLAVGELIARKNHETLIRAIADFPSVYLTIVGSGQIEKHLKNLIKELKLEDRVKLLGYRSDISELCTAADVFSLPSFHEGLPVALMEAMACGKPCVVSDIRGNVDLIKEENALFNPNSVESTKKAIKWILESNMERIGLDNIEVVKKFAIEAVLEDMKAIYNEKFQGGGYTLVEGMYKRALVRKELGIPQNAVLLISVGELNKNKNHETVIKSINGLDVYYIIAGVGGEKEHLQNLIDEQNMTERIKLLGYRTDMIDLYNASDMFVFPSYREGLSVALMEVMACGLICVVSRIRGNTDLIDNNGGALFDPYDVNDCRTKIEGVLSRGVHINEYNVEKIKRFSTEAVVEKMRQLYYQ